MIMQAIKLKKGSQEPGKKSAGTLSNDQLRAIAEEKMADLNTNNIEAAMKTVAGAARSMGVQIV
jgi:large subunit ribosomal protein L11